MTLPFTSVVSYHTNPMTCGVAKFSAELAKRLGVPFGSYQDRYTWGAFPLLSLKWGEMPKDGWALPFPFDKYALFWHDAGNDLLSRNARHVFYADPSLGSPGLWCPSLIAPRQRPVRLFSFGMAHKLQTQHYVKVKQLLDAAGKRYHLRVSVGLHEGTSLDGAEKHFDALREIMGPENVTILGILSDDAVSEELQNADYVLAFFEKGLRANNTTVHAALNANVPVITNHNECSPKPMMRVTFDIDGLLEWPRHTWDAPYSWDNLITAMRKECAKSRSQIA